MSLASSLVKRVKAIFRRGDRVSDAPDVSVQLRDAVATIGNADAMDLARRLSAKEITLTTFQQELYLMTRHAHIAQFALSRGGMDALTAADREVLGRLVGEQASYLRQFVADIGAGKLTPEQIAQRAVLYPESSVKAHSLGMMAAFDLDPPNVPPEHPHCRCKLRTSVDDDGPAVYWDAQPDACPVCVGIAATMNPWRPA